MCSEALPSAHHYRTILANERTFLAWQGMAAGLLVASIAIQCIRMVNFTALWQVLAIALATGSAVTACTGLRRWRTVDRVARRPDTG